LKTTITTATWHDGKLTRGSFKIFKKKLKISWLDTCLIRTRC